MKGKRIGALALVLMLFLCALPVQAQGTAAAQYAGLQNRLANAVGRGCEVYYCLAFVKDFFVEYYGLDYHGGSNMSFARNDAGYNCCAYNYGRYYVDSTSRDSIPIGACVFFSSYPGRAKEPSCGHYPGHIGIYVGNGEIVHAWNTEYAQKHSIDAILAQGYGWMGWGWFADYAFEPASLQATSTEEGVRLTWKAPPDVETAITRNEEWLAASWIGAPTVYVDKNVEPGKSYTYTVYTYKYKPGTSELIWNVGIPETGIVTITYNPPAPKPEPTITPTPEPKPEPTVTPTPEPEPEPKPEPTVTPTSEPEPEPTVSPTDDPTTGPADKPEPTPDEGNKDDGGNEGGEGLVPDGGGDGEAEDAKDAAVSIPGLDEGSALKISEPTEADLEILSAQKGKAQTILASYDLDVEGELPEGGVDLCFDMGTEYSGETLYVLHLHGAETRSYNGVVDEAGILTIHVDGFSPFLILRGAPDVANKEDGKESGGTGGTGSSGGSTGSGTSGSAGICHNHAPSYRPVYSGPILATPTTTAASTSTSTIRTAVVAEVPATGDMDYLPATLLACACILWGLGRRSRRRG